MAIMCSRLPYLIFLGVIIQVLISHKSYHGKHALLCVSSYKRAALYEVEDVVIKQMAVCGYKMSVLLTYIIPIYRRTSYVAYTPGIQRR